MTSDVGERFENKFAKLKLAKLAIDSTSLEVTIPKSEILILLFYSYIIPYLMQSWCKIKRCVLSVATDGKVTYSNASDGSPKKVVVGDVLRFLTGAPVIPPGGFGRKIRQLFTSERRYISASTCALDVTLPLHYTSISEFSGMMMEAVISSPGFGQV